MKKEKCEKCGAEKTEAISMSYTNKFDEENPTKKENYEHTHGKVLICADCLKQSCEEIDKQGGDEKN